MIHCMTPFDTEKNLGRAYNRAMGRLGEDDWALFLDHDAMWTTRDWYRQCEEAVGFQPRALFTAVTNRIASPWQRASEAGTTSDDIKHHRLIGSERLKRRTLLDISCTKGFGGVVMLMSRQNWAEIGGFVDGMGCVDHMAFFSTVATGRPVYLIEGLYVYHFRGTCGTPLERGIPKAVGCQCRGHEDLPTKRVHLP